jgi:NAD(P)-dependent dehydrogenase (short-subunit alcohol dehydrogenase family)
MATSSEAGELKTVLITGGTDGLGRATALLLAKEGYRVFTGGRNAARRSALEAEAREKKLPLEVLEMDVCDDASVNHAVEEAERRAGPVDVLVNNAGIGIAATIEEISMRDLRQQFETNFFAAVRVAQRVLPGMRARRRGRIINMSSVAGKISNPVLGYYSASKFALEAMSDALRLELHPFGISVVLIEPGYIPSGMGQASMELSSAYTRRVAESPYGPVYEGFLRFWKKTTKNPKYTPHDCARVILRALRDTPPKARYTVTRDAWVGVRLKRLLSDRMLDRMLIRTLGLDKIRPGATLDPAAARAALEELSKAARR